MKNKIAIIVPIYNEEEYLPLFLKKLLPEVRKIKDRCQIIFINDGSIDKTSQILAKLKKKNKNITILTLKNNKGKGHAMRVGAQEAIKKNFSKLIYMDGDGQHDPIHLKQFIKYLDFFPIVFGYRQLKKNTPLFRKLGNRITSFVIRNVFRIKRIGDVLCGYFGLQTEVYKDIKWQSNDYGVEAEISTIISRKRIPFKEILVKTIYLNSTKGVNLFHALTILMRFPYWAAIRHMERILKFLLLLGLFSLFLLLAYKDPSSTRSLIPNLEPYPDTLYYSNPAWNFVNNRGFEMKAFDYQAKIITPPLYSYFLIPFFAVFNDIRSFYFANMTFMIGAIYLFLVIAKKLFYSKLFDLLIIGFIGFFFVTNFYFYSQLYLLMAESLTLFFSMLALYFLLTPITRLKSFLAGLQGLGMLMIKFSNAPLAAAFLALYAFRLLKESKENKRAFVFSLFAAAGIFITYIFSTQIFSGHKNLSGDAAFSPTYFASNFKQYVKVLLGERERYLWFDHRMINLILVFPTILGIVITLIVQKWRKNSSLLLIYGLSIVVFLSFFYTRDIRYIIPIVPVLLLMAGYALLFIKEQFGQLVSFALMAILFTAHLLLHEGGQIPGERPAITYKKQIGLNFKYAEVPWNYNAVIEFNKFFDKKLEKKPYLGTLLPPYFVGYYANGNYNYLPVSMGQEFYGDKLNKPKVFLTSLTDYYKQLLNEGHEIYVSPYYQANLKSWQTDYENLIKEFNVEKVHEGCFNTCDIYRLTTLSPVEY